MKPKPEFNVGDLVLVPREGSPPTARPAKVIEITVNAYHQHSIKVEYSDTGGVVWVDAAFIQEIDATTAISLADGCKKAWER